MGKSKSWLSTVLPSNDRQTIEHLSIY